MTVTQTATPGTNGGLTFDTTVPRELVHKQSVHEVLLTDACKLEEDVYVFAGQLPRTHSFYSDGFYDDGVSIRYDTMLPMELARQAAVFVSHRWHDVPRSFRFVFMGIDMSVEHPEALAVGAAPANVILTLKTLDRQYYEDTLTGFTMHAEFNVDGVDAATASGQLMFMPRRFYEKMRSKQREAQGLTPEPPMQCNGRRFPVAPQLLGRANETNVVLSGLNRDRASGRYEAGVVVDDRHPCLFDHRLDHVPGMLLIEAHRQIGVAAAADRLGVSPGRLIITRTATTFTSFAELDFGVDAEATVETRDAEEIHAKTRIVQRDNALSEGEFTFVVAG